MKRTLPLFVAILLLVGCDEEDTITQETSYEEDQQLTTTDTLDVLMNEFEMWYIKQRDLRVLIDEKQMQADTALSQPLIDELKVLKEEYEYSATQFALIAERVQSAKTLFSEEQQQRIAELVR